MPISVSAFLISSQVHLNVEAVQVFVYFEGNNKTELHVARGQRLFFQNIINLINFEWGGIPYVTVVVMLLKKIVLVDNVSVEPTL